MKSWKIDVGTITSSKELKVPRSKFCLSANITLSDIGGCNPGFVIVADKFSVMVSPVYGGHIGLCVRFSVPIKAKRVQIWPQGTSPSAKVTVLFERGKRKP